MHTHVHCHDWQYLRLQDGKEAEEVHLNLHEPCSVHTHCSDRRCMQMQEEKEGEEVHMLEEVEAGTVVEGLSFRLLDEEGNPTCQGLKGKKTTSWSHGTRTATMAKDGSPETLVALTVSTHALGLPLAKS